MHQRNYLSVENEKGKAELRATLKENMNRPMPSPERLKMGFQKNEERLRKLAAQEKARREAAAAKGRTSEDASPTVPRAPIHEPERVELPPKVHFAPARPDTALSSSSRPETAASARSDVSESEKPDAPFRNELLAMPIERLRKYCAEVGASCGGDKLALVGRLMEHARKMAAERCRAEHPPPKGAASSHNSGAEPPRPSSPTLSVASLSLDPPPTGQSFIAASSFECAKPKYVFKKDAKGLGYYRDSRQ